MCTSWTHLFTGQAGQGKGRFLGKDDSWKELFGYLHESKQYQAGHWILKSAEAARFVRVSPSSRWKLSYFEVLIKFKKISHTICDS